MSPKVSVIIPVYNAEGFIIDTINSILNQTYKNIEIIIIDDHSTDNSYEIALRYTSDKIIIGKNQKKGACAARNRGFELSSGDYIQYLDADDLLSENKIQSQVELLKNCDDVCVASGMWGRFITDPDKVNWSHQIINKNYERPFLWLLDSWSGKGMGQTSIWLTPRALIEQSGEWNENLQINQDGEFFCRVLLNSKAIVFCENAKVFYRSGNANSISQSNNLSYEKAESLLNSFISYKYYAKQKGLVKELKTGLAQNFLMFMYQFYNFYPNLAKNAANEFYDLGFIKMWPVGGYKFKKLSSIVGFQKALQIKKLLK
ncbi:MAG: glycosyltransferase family 2 protein [Gelidibacter sp.]